MIVAQNLCQKTVIAWIQKRSATPTSEMPNVKSGMVEKRRFNDESFVSLLNVYAKTDDILCIC
jgi:hypothetical protein